MSETFISYTRTPPHTPCEGENASQAKVAVSARIEEKTISTVLLASGGNGATSAKVVSETKNHRSMAGSGKRLAARRPRATSTSTLNAPGIAGSALCGRERAPDDALSLPLSALLQRARPGDWLTLWRPKQSDRPTAIRQRLTLKFAGRAQALECVDHLEVGGFLATTAPVSAPPSGKTRTGDSASGDSSNLGQIKNGGNTR